MSTPKFIRVKGQVYRLAQPYESVLKPADYKLCKFVTDNLGGSQSRMLHDCEELVDKFSDLGYTNPMDRNQQKAFFEEVFENGWLTGQTPQQYEAAARPRFIKVNGQVYQLVDSDR